MHSFPPPDTLREEDDGPRPNYRLRRILAIVVAVVVVGGAGLGGWALFGRSDGGDTKGAPLATMVRLSGGSLEVLDADLKTVTTIKVGSEFSPSMAASPPGYLVANRLSSDGTLAVVDIAAGSVAAVKPRVAMSPDSAQTKLFGPTSVALVDDAAGSVVVIDVVDGQQLDLRTLIRRPEAQVFETGARFTPGYRLFGSFDGQAPGFIVVSTTTLSESWQLTGKVLDLSGTKSLLIPLDDLTAAAVHLVVFDKDKPTDLSVELTAFPVGAILRDDHTALVAAADGSMQVADLVKGTVVGAGSLGFAPTSVFRLSADRFFATGDNGSALADLDGKVLRSWDLVAGVAVVPFRSGTACGVFQPGYRPVGTGEALAQLVDLTTAKVLANFDNSPAPVSDDGCTVGTSFGGALQLAVDGAVVPVAKSSTAKLTALSPDGSRSVISRSGGGASATVFLLDMTTKKETELAKGSYLFIRPAPAASGSRTTTPTGSTSGGTSTSAPSSQRRALVLRCCQ